MKNKLPVTDSDDGEDENQLSQFDLDAINSMHALLDHMHGTGFSADNPAVVAEYLKAFALRSIANSAMEAVIELAELRGLLASGSGAITVGIDKG